ncbi:rRNA maturation RNase YbeY [Mycoplasma nasistruthionis]|uniref:Endoribonuclease YbeY n=1 Tax=Mycoplasma nasistruthionis TaxID=353852 RepID=A0A5B7XW03_9MOLU|nr:rRNA maturation RNase YbeY [Mycoplasma nasistruthionis]QCZ36645.1 rRNA maturation RNase YbeY [Mycoplasma nasistruthionis]
MTNDIELNIDNKIKRATPFEAEMMQILDNFKQYFKIKQHIIVDVSIVSKQKIRKLNAIHRQKDYVTDILSFGFEAADIYQNLPVYHLGELVICWDKVEVQAKEFGHSIRREFCYLFTHGLVHLKGYDHEVEQERIVMNQIVDDIFKPLNITRED